VIGGTAKSIRKLFPTYFGLFGSPGMNSVGTDESTLQWPMPAAGTVSNLYVRLSESAGAAGTSYTFTIRKNGSSTGVACTAVAAASTCSDTSGSVTFAAGDLISVQASPSATPPADNLDVAWTAKFAGS